MSLFHLVAGLCVGNTDTRHYLGLSDNIYRFSPTVYRPEDVARFHGPNERIAITNYAKLVNFYFHTIDNADNMHMSAPWTNVPDTHEL